MPSYTIACAYDFHRGLRRVVARAMLVDESGALAGIDLDPDQCSAELFGESGSLGSVAGAADPAGEPYALFLLADQVPSSGHAYVLRIHLEQDGGAWTGTRDFPMATR